LAIVELGNTDNTLLTRLDYELAEAVEAGVAFIEVGVDLLHDLLQPIGPHHVPVSGHLRHGFRGELPWIPLGGRGVDFLGQPRQIVVRVVLVAVLDQQIAGRFPDAHSDHVLPILLELDDHGGEVTVAREQNEGSDLWPSEHQLDGVDGQADVGRVFLARAKCRSEDEIDGRLGERDDVLRVAAPVSVGSLDRDLALDDVAVEESAKLFGQVLLDAEGDIIEVDE
jgi:hypothetical protein